ncbi:hypothetical protein K2173_001627 [Erythroxylum novogranatense]|uniref:Uncharacterized protein n=1 Tax=Erythroxylum novogranatense TaxID=1862640 RepID=A0AAV8T5I9_9ROSI|nr:hypothetical protein K2173_001627 [Erythroxylum novogranatense]
MPSAIMRKPFNQWDLMYSGGGSKRNGQLAANLSAMVFGFLENGEGCSPATLGSKDCELDQVLEAEQEKNACLEKDKSFWENQHQLLQATLCRTTSLESSIRNITKETIKELQTAGTLCGCGRLMTAGCRNCLMREVSSRLSRAGYNSSICKTKWRSSPEIQSGEHAFIDVIDNTNSKKGEVRVIIELHFQAEFEMAKASEDYRRLLHRLPEVFIGKVERLNSVIKILCTAAKICMKEKKMHLGPWRKQKYMQAKWLSSFERTAPMTPLSMGKSGRSPKPRASMLTVDLRDMLPDTNCSPVAVV